ncbi:MAG: EAL domain-containing protein [Actinobacteria bacterium]|nr:EAL domain-containing protein [Actinomycetota bacterium]
MESLRVVIADDDLVLREALTEVITASGLEVVAGAADAESAIAMAREHQPDLVLLDVKMPHGGGPRAAQEIARECPATRVVALSAYDDRGAILEMLHAGAMSYLIKGVSTNREIIDTLRRTAAGEISLPASVGEKVLHELGEHLDRTHSEERRRQSIDARVRRVIAAGQVDILFQPIRQLATGSVAGYEALARFDAGSTRGPRAWLDDARSVDALLELELLAVRAALAHVAELPAGTYLAVNVSPATATDEGLQDLVLSAAPSATVLEITEHAPVDDYEGFHRAVEPLRSAGVRLAIDDTGAGMASLRHLLSLAPDVIKLDVSLTRGIDSDRSRRALARALISFADDTGSQIVAEGVETDQELHALVDLGVTYGQGYFLGVPRASLQAGTPQGA